MKNRWGLGVLILLLAAFFRFWDLKNAPPGLWADEAVNGGKPPPTSIKI